MTRPWHTPSGAVRDAGPYVKDGRRCVPAAGHIGPALQTGTDCPAWFVGQVRYRTRSDIRPPSVGKSGRRGILRQAKVWLRWHTGFMPRSHTAGMAQKARRAPQTHGRWVALTEKNRVKLFIFSPIAARRRFCNTPCFSATLSLCHSLSKQKGGRNHCGKRYTKRIKKSYWPTAPA